MPTKDELCACNADPFADLPPELRPTGRDEAARKRVGLRKVVCPGCGLVFTTNRDTDYCPDCERKGVMHSTSEQGEEPTMQLDIKVLGPGCAKCEYLEQRARLAIEEVKAEVPELQASIEKLTDMADFMAYGLMMTPGLVINGKLVSEGRVASQRTIAEWLRAALNGGQ